jgi:hypothetical protein
MAGIFANTDNTMTNVTFDNPKVVFGSRPITIIGACVERNLVYMGLSNTDGEPLNTALPNELIETSVFDEHPRGPVLVVKTHDDGTLLTTPFDIQAQSNGTAIVANVIEP